MGRGCGRLCRAVVVTRRGASALTWGNVGQLENLLVGDGW